MLRKRNIAEKNDSSKVPTFAKEEQAADWFAAHETAPYMDGLQKVTEKIPIRRTRSTSKGVSVRVSANELKAIKEVADRKGVPFEVMVRKWLLERLRQEAPDLLRH